MQKLGVKFVRVMSFAVSEGEDQMEQERFRRLREVTKMFLDAGIQPVHENCMNYGGMGWLFALKLLENVPGLQWVFDYLSHIIPTGDPSAPPPPSDYSDFIDYVNETGRMVIGVGSSVRWGGLTLSNSAA